MMRKAILLLVVTAATTLCAQTTRSVLQAGDRIESTSYNDHKRGKPRRLNYLPDGEDFVSINGENRYTRALYGSPTAWRLETSDRPIFASYVKGDNRNIRFRLRLPSGEETALEQTDYCEARYTPGRRTYLLRHAAWGEGAALGIAVLCSPTEESAIWQFVGQGLPEGCTIQAIASPIRLTKLSRSGDMGADPPLCFDPAPDQAPLQTLDCPLLSTTAMAASGESLRHNLSTLHQPLSAEEGTLSIAHCALTDNLLCLPATSDALATIDTCEQHRMDIASSVRIQTPDPYINTLGSALAIAADGIWGTEEVWLHGAIGWRMPLSGWRAAYTGDAIGRHDRARLHFNHYAASQVTDVPQTIPHPAQDSALALARSVKKWGTPQYSNGYICRNPERNNQMNHYDMNLCYMDELLWHLCWTGDVDYARRMWPVMQRHLAWEKRNYDPDDDGLYDAYACIWASDALYYNSGAVTHSSAYNYRANRLMALIAQKIGEDPTPYQREADRILHGLNTRLWLHDRGHWAEFQDFMGLQRLHEHAAVWTIYHAIDSDVADAFQAYTATRYVDRHIPHIPVTALTTDYADPRLHVAACDINAGGYATVSTTDWLPYSWSINNVAFAEVMHTALAYFQAGRSEEGFHLMKSSVLDGMYLGESPGNFGQISFYDAARGECYRDFGDPIGVASRLIVQGLYGILPDALRGQLLIRPGFPQDWDHASLHTADIDFAFSTTTDAATDIDSTSPTRANGPTTIDFAFSAVVDGPADGATDGGMASPADDLAGTPGPISPEADGAESMPHTNRIAQTRYRFTHRLPAVSQVELQVPAARSEVKALTVNGQPATWTLVGPAIGRPMLSIGIAAQTGEAIDLVIDWAGEAIATPAAATATRPSGSDKPADATVTPNLDNLTDISTPGSNNLADTSVTPGLSALTTGTAQPTGETRRQGPVDFIACSQGQMKWWMPVEREGADPNPQGEWMDGQWLVDGKPSGLSTFEHVLADRCAPIDLSQVLNASVTDIFQPDKYLSPRSPYTTLQIPTQGIGEWCHPLMTAVVDDSGLRAASHDGRLSTSLGIPFLSPEQGDNVAFTSLWDNYPDSLTVPLSGKASHAYLLMAGSTNHMQCHIANGEVQVHYRDGSQETLTLTNPLNWAPIEQVFFEDGLAFDRHAPSLYRLCLQTAEGSDRLAQSPAYTGVVREVKGGAALILDLPLNPRKRLSHLTLRTLSNEVVIGLMGLTLQR